MQKKSSRGKAAKILVIDDDPAILDLLRAILTPEGYLLFTADDGAVALRLLLRTDFDLVITDFNMPSLSGKDIYKQAGEARPGTEKRFIFISGDTDSDVKTRFHENTKARVIKKPFAPDLVRSTIREALESSS
jgi:DNA-binding response OmpR family regulator